MYAHLRRAKIENHNKRIWKSKIPLKIKIFMWVMQLNAILTKDILAKRKWQGDVRCSFCNQNENITHMFFECFLDRYVWSLVAMIIGADCRSVNLEQYLIWCGRYLPLYKNIHMVGLSAICWALWKSRNSICFDKNVSNLLLRSYV
jgi:hypothetical protein